jgi:sugar transferase (PEP-CTERM/EpsH1 system associated)
MRPVRVMHIVFALQPGGMELGVIKLVNNLTSGRVVSSICSTRPAGPAKSLVSALVPIFELQRRNGNDPAVIWRLYRLFRRERPDIVHTHAWGTLVEGLVAARAARVPVVIHGEHGTLQLRRHQVAVQRWGWTAADRMVTVSSRLADRIAQVTHFPRERIQTIRNGVELSRFGRVNRDDARRTISIGVDSRVVVAIGRLVPVKDHMTLLEAIAIVRSQHRENLTLLIAGDGPLKAALTERATSLGIGSCVHLLGHRTDVENVLAAADVFVQSSQSEGLSNTILEAMASGLPVIATRVGGADEMVEDGTTGLLVTPGSGAELAKALGTVLRDPARRLAMGVAGRARAECEFGLESMVARYEDMYLELAWKRSGLLQPAVPAAIAGGS